jgi:superoxide dismutase, Cu-Zn family
MKSFFHFSCFVAAALALSACANFGAASPQASSQLEARSGSAVGGTARFVQSGDRVLVKIDVAGLNPGQEHGMHAHEKGDCSAADGASAGGHFNPTGKPHGAPGGDHHAGDMPALKADANGRASVSFELAGVDVASGPQSLVGRALIIHKDADDYKTQPTGNSGARIACGVIVRS